MKVLFVTPYYHPNLKGGSERSLKILTEGLAKRDIQVVVMSFDGQKMRHEEFLNGVKVIRIKKPSWHPNTLALNISLLSQKRTIEKENPDIIHVYNTWQIPAGYFLKKYSKVVATLNNYYPLCATSYTKNNIIEKGDLSFVSLFSGIFKTFEGNFLKKAIASLGYSIYTEMIKYPSRNLDGYIAYASPVKEIYIRAGFNGNKIKVIQSPFEKKIVHKQKRLKNTVLYVGGAMASKGFFEMIEAIKLIKNRKITFWMAGFDKSNEAILKLQKKGFNVIPLGRLNEKELEKRYLAASVLIHPSQWPEPFSRIWVESLQFGIPIISSDNPVAKEVLKGGAAFYRRGHPHELAFLIERFLENKINIDLSKLRRSLLSNDPIESIINLYGEIKG